ncbi:ABC transporter substrate-binding protein [Paraeggerthella sp.]|uniref:ABC transporter substrate-binding protein n=1 Tax=Paraeggerthella sp. TaxID=2897350 RepID=UPI0035273C41
MEMLSRRTFLKGVLVGIGSAAAFGFAGCSGASQGDASGDVGAKTAEAPSQQDWTFEDQAGNTVTVGVPVQRMVVMQHHSLDMLAQLGQQGKVAGVEKNWEGDLGSYMRDVFPGIDDLPAPGDLTDWSVEAIAALKPDVVIAASQANPDAMKQVTDLGIPVVVVSLRGEGKQAEAQNPRLADADAAYTEGCQWAISTLGRLTGTEQKASDIWKMCLESRAIVDRAIGKMDDADRVRVFVANEKEKTYGNDKYVGCQLLRAGAKNVAAEAIQGYKPYTFEMLASWDPEVIIVQDRYMDVYDAVTTDPRYRELSAVKNGKVLLAPYWTKPWGNPDTDSIALGELWLANRFYPEKVSADTVREYAERFYRDFYGVEFAGTV